LFEAEGPDGVARKKSPNLTEAELRLMEVLWSRGPSTVAEVVAALPGEPPVAYSTVLTTLRILENKGYLRHSKQSRAFVYEPVLNRTEARRNVLRYVLDRFFGNSPEALVLNLIEDREFSNAELARLKAMIESGNKEGR
jgi:predicted transcriptional regulator